MRLRPGIKIIPFTLCGTALVAFGLWIYTGIRLGIWKYSQYARYHWVVANLPITRELWHGEIKAGDDVEKIISSWPPHGIRRYGSWVDLRWYAGGRQTNHLSLIGIAVVAKDGVLVRADSYSDDLLCARTFFNTLTRQAEAEHRTAFARYVDGLRTNR